MALYHAIESFDCLVVAIDDILGTFWLSLPVIVEVTYEVCLVLFESKL